MKSFSAARCLAGAALALMCVASLTGRGVSGSRDWAVAPESGGSCFTRVAESGQTEKKNPKPGKPAKKQEKARKAKKGAKTLVGFSRGCFCPKFAGLEPGAPGVSRCAPGAEELLKKPAPEASVGIWDAFG